LPARPEPTQIEDHFALLLDRLFSRVIHRSHGVAGPKLPLDRGNQSNEIGSCPREWCRSVGPRFGPRFDQAATPGNLTVVSLRDYRHEEGDGRPRDAGPAESGRGSLQWYWQRWAWCSTPGQVDLDLVPGAATGRASQRQVDQRHISLPNATIAAKSSSCQWSQYRHTASTRCTPV
jgi:hypothetical protein